jgi:hypothetical protein
MQRTNAILTLSGIPDDNKRKRIFDLDPNVGSKATRGYGSAVA